MITILNFALSAAVIVLAGLLLGRLLDYILHGSPAPRLCRADVLRKAGRDIKRGLPPLGVLTVASWALQVDQAFLYGAMIGLAICGLFILLFDAVRTATRRTYA